MKRKLIGRAVLVVVAIAALALALRHYGQPLLRSIARARALVTEEPAQEPTLPRRGPDLDANIRACLRELETDSASVREQRLTGDSNANAIVIRASVPRGHQPEEVVWLLERATDRTSYRLSDCVYVPREGAYHLVYESTRPRAPEVRLVWTWANRWYSRAARIAFLVQDFGFRPDQTTMELLSFAEPLTVSLVAIEDKSDWTARIAEHYRKEVVILLPLEPKVIVASPYRNGMTMVHHAEADIVRAVDAAAERIPVFSGYCNLWGSRVLEDSRVTRIILSAVKRQHGYFIDTRSTPLTLVPAMATALRLPYREVDAALDERGSAERLSQQIDEAVARAQKSGSALITAPPSAAFIAALRKKLPDFAPSGVSLVYVSDILIHPED
jgi:polysaccharide deacetylase 2 family uncharacterized protein YibQ